MTAGGMLDRTAIRLTKQVRNLENTIDCERNHGMPNLLHSTKHSWHSVRLHTFTQTLAHVCIGDGGILCNFAHPYGNIFAPSRYLTPTWNLMKRAGEFRCRSYQPESIIATAASGSKAKRSVFRKSGTDAST
jgi:hypothetical protein